MIYFIFCRNGERKKKQKRQLDFTTSADKGLSLYLGQILMFSLIE